MIHYYLRKAKGFGRLFFGGGSGGTANTQEFKPPSWTTSYGAAGEGPWQDYLQKAIGLSNQPPDIYPGQTIAGLTPEQKQGFDMTYQRAVNGAPDLNAARGQLTATSQGQYLNSNPYLGQNSQYTQNVIGQNATNMANAYRLGTGAQTDAMYGLGGAFGGSAYQQMTANNASGLANSVGQMANQYQLARTGLGAQDYAGERNNMMQAAQLTPGLANDDWTAAQALTGVGDAYRSYNQDLLNQGVAAFNQQKQAPYQGLDVLGNALARASGNAAGGSMGITSQNYQASPLASLLGLGALGYGVLG